MTKLHLLVTAVLMFFGQSTAFVKWMIANPPIIFGKAAQLSCVSSKPNISHTIDNATSWLGGKDYSSLIHTGAPADGKKYAEIRRWHRSKFESILQINKFDEMDVNVNYSCSFGLQENKKRLSLEPDKFEYHPGKNTTTVHTSFRNGYLVVIVKILKVYPIPKCTIMFNENLIPQRLKTEPSVNGIFYKVVEEAKHQVDVCSGKLIVTCLVGKTEIQIHQESFNTCTKIKEISPDYTKIYIIVIALLFVIILMGCLARNAKLRNFLCCRVRWRGEERILVRHVEEIVLQLTQQRREGATNDNGQDEHHEMIQFPKQ